MTKSGWNKTLVINLIIAGILLPLVLYWVFLGRVPSLSAQEALLLLDRSEEEVILVDVRDPDSFRAKQVVGAQNWPLTQVMVISSTDQVPAPLQEKTLLILCEDGLTSASAVHRLLALGLERVYFVRGGLQAWVAVLESGCQTWFCQIQSVFSPLGDSLFRISPSYEQWAAVISAFAIKPLYMLLSLVLVIVLVRLRAPDISALRWALVFFFVGESFCALNYLFFQEDSYLFEFFHSYGMVVAFSFTIFAIMEGLDRRVIKLSNPNKRCASLELCGSCVKYRNVPCGARRLFLLLMPLVGILTLIPLLATPHTTSYNTNIMGTFYNYAHPVILQIFEIRYLPIVAIFLMTIACISLWLNQNGPPASIAKLFFAAGVGVLSFSIFRLVFHAVYKNNLVWSTFWEEMTELLYVIAIGCILWIFRRQLFRENVPGIPSLI